MKRQISTAMAVAISATSVVGLLAPDQVQAEEKSAIERLGGKDRYETCVKICDRLFEKAETVVLTSGEKYPDALTAGAYAAKSGLPLLLTEKDSLPQPIEKQLKKLKVKNIILVGGENSISKDLADRLGKEYKLERISGADRFETSIALAKKDGNSSKSKPVLVNGNTFSDSILAGSLASKLSSLVVLTDGNRLTDQHLNIIDKTSKDNIIVGGKNSMNIPGLEGKRVAGEDRYQTSLQIAKDYYPKADKAILVSGEKFVDALASSGISAKEDRPILLSKAQVLNKHVADYLSKDIKSVLVVGGSNSISDGVYSTVEKAIKVDKKDDKNKDDKDKDGKKPSDNKDNKKPGKKPEKKPGKKPENNPGKKPENNPGNKPGNEPGKKPENNPGNKPGNEPGKKPEDNPGNKPGNDPSKKPEKEGEKTSAYADGKWLGVGEGFKASEDPNNKMEVEVDIKDGKIVAINLTKYADDKGFKDSMMRFADRFYPEIIKQNGTFDLLDRINNSLKNGPNSSVDLDVATGATYSNRGLVEAINDALKKASLAKSGSDQEALSIKDLTVVKKSASAAVHWNDKLSIRDTVLRLTKLDNSSVDIPYDKIGDYGIELNYKDGTVINKDNMEIGPNGDFYVNFTHKASKKTASIRLQVQKRLVEVMPKKMEISFDDGNKKTLEMDKDGFTYDLSLGENESSTVKDIKLFNDKGEEISGVSFKALANNKNIISISLQAIKDESDYEIKTWRYGTYNLRLNKLEGSKPSEPSDQEKPGEKPGSGDQTDPNSADPDSGKDDGEVTEIEGEEDEENPGKAESESLAVKYKKILNSRHIGGIPIPYPVEGYLSGPTKLSIIEKDGLNYDKIKSPFMLDGEFLNVDLKIGKLPDYKAVDFGMVDLELTFSDSSVAKTLIPIQYKAIPVHHLTKLYSNNIKSEYKMGEKLNFEGLKVLVSVPQSKVGDEYSSSGKAVLVPYKDFKYFGLSIVDESGKEIKDGKTITADMVKNGSLKLSVKAEDILNKDPDAMDKLPLKDIMVK